MSYFIITDGKTISKFGTAQDHKRALEGDLGKNTGGMGGGFEKVCGKGGVEL